MLADNGFDAIVIGSGPNGLAAAITIALSGRSVLVLEAAETVGGGMRTKELTMPGFRHDVCASVHPLAVASPFFRSLHLEDYGLEWVHPPTPLAHPLDNDPAVLLERSIDDTSRGLGVDGYSYGILMEPFVKNWEKLVQDVLSPLHFPAHPLTSLPFSLKGIISARTAADRWFDTKRARTLFAGNACHSILPLENMSTAAFGLMLGMLGHAVGWPFVKGGSQALAEALSSCLRSLGGKLILDRPVSSIEELPASKFTLLDVSPSQMESIVGDRFPANYRLRLKNHRHGPGVFKIDWALRGVIPWKGPACLKAGTLHLGGTLEEIAASERQISRGNAPDKPFVLLSQASLFDATRASEGMHTAWAYCHVPNACAIDMTDAIENQVERFAPGFRDLIKAKHVMSPARMEDYNPNYIGGDIVGGIQSFPSLFIRPFGRWEAYATPVKGMYMCSASMPPGGGVHGMCGHLAAMKALKRMRPA